eukprot:scaffold247413_cov50-Prasinocladus_malaysianus.AAC.1
MGGAGRQHRQRLGSDCLGPLLCCCQAGRRPSCPGSGWSDAIHDPVQLHLRGNHLNNRECNTKTKAAYRTKDRQHPSIRCLPCLRLESCLALAWWLLKGLSSLSRLSRALA